MTAPRPTAADKRAAAQLERMDAALAAVDGQLDALLRQGALRATTAGVDGLRALAQQCHTAGLIRVSRLMEALATQLARVRDRDPLASLTAWADTLNQAWLLTRRLQAERAAGAEQAELAPLMGEARRTYQPVAGDLTVQTLCAWGWVTDAGFMGVSLRLTSPQVDQPLLVTVARPTLHFGEEPARLWSWPLHDALPLNGKDLGHGAWTLSEARCSADGRLSLHGDLRAEPAPWQGAAAFAPLRCERFVDVLARLRAADLDLVSDRSAGTLVWIEPQAVGPPQTDRTRGRTTLTLTDRGGATLQVVVPTAPWHALLVENLGLLAAGQTDRGRRLPQPTGWVGRAQVDGERLTFLPHTLVFDAPLDLGGRGGHHYTHLLHLSLERLASARWAKGGA